MATLTVKGLNEVIQEIDKAPRIIMDGIVGIVDRLGSKISAEMTKEAPIDRGGIRRSIGKKIEKKMNGISLTVGPTEKYALFVHSGTGKYRDSMDRGKAGQGRVRSYWLNRFNGDRQSMETFFRVGSKRGFFNIMPNKFVDRTADRIQSDVDRIVADGILNIKSKL